MGMNFYLERKIDYVNEEETPTSLGCGYDEDPVQVLINGYVWRNTYYSSIEELNKVFTQKLHIGKSSIGWHFGLCIYPEYGINILEDWIKLFRTNGNIILDEEERIIKTSEMLDRIENRKQPEFEKYESEQEYEEAIIKNYNKINNIFYNVSHHKKLYNSYDEILRENHACRGLKGLWRRQRDQYTSYPTPDGTFDYIKSGNDVEKCCIFS